VAENTKNDFVLYPNPVNETVTIKNNEQFTNAVFVLYNNLGQVVVTQKIENFYQNVSLEHINSGIYFYKIMSATFTQTGKIIKN
jgi:hypothetical protein